MGRRRGWGGFAPELVGVGLADADILEVAVATAEPEPGAVPATVGSGNRQEVAEPGALEAGFEGIDEQANAESDEQVVTSRTAIQNLVSVAADQGSVPSGVPDKADQNSLSALGAM